MSLIQSCMKKINGLSTLECIQAELIYPKLVIFENKRTVHILDVTNLNEILTIKVHSFQIDIIDQIVYEDNVWVILKSGELFVISLTSGALIEVICLSDAYYKVQRFTIYESKLILISESGERLVFSIKHEALEEEFVKKTKDIQVTINKALLPINAIYSNKKNILNGINISIESGKLILQCLHTGLNDVIVIHPKLQFVLLWNEMIVIATDLKMYVLNEKFDFIFEFENTGSQYIPVSSCNDILYYVTWNNNEIGINYAALSTCTEQNNISYSVAFKTKLSSQETLKMQLKSMVDETLSGSKTPEQTLSQLQVLFNEIEDFVFLVNIASTLCNHNLLYKPIVYPLQKQIYATGDQHLITLICDTIIKTELIEYICFKGGNFYENINIFNLKFIDLCILFVSKSDFDLATICWLKYMEIMGTLDSSDINNLLNAIPHNTKLGALVIWFRNFIPPLLDHNPFYIDLFVKWTTDRVFNLEQSPYWPKIGLKFIATVIEVLETAIKTICVRPISIDDLDIIKDHISYIMELKEKYKINMLLSEFSSQSPSEIALIMLRRCYTEDLPLFLQESLPSYTSRHLLEIDVTLRSYVESEAASSGGCIDGNRLEILLKSFHSPTSRLDCLLNVLKVLDVPWDKNVSATATAAAVLALKDFTLTDADRSLSQEIYKELNYAKIKVILKKYNFPLTCTDYVLVIHKLINASTVNLDDLKVITNILTSHANYANTLYIDRCLQDCDTKLALEYFKNLPNRTQQILIKTMQHKFEHIITSTAMNPLLERNYIDFLKGSLLLDNIEIKLIENLYYLKNSFNIQLNLNDINNSNTCEHILNKLKKNKEVISSSGHGGCMLQLVSGQQSKLITLLRRTSSSQNVRLLIESVLLTNSETQKDLSLLSQYKDGHNSTLLLECYEILSEVLTNCGEEHLHSLLNYLSMFNALIHAGITLKNLSIAWKFQYIYLPMSSLNTLNDLINFYSSCTENNLLQPESINIFSKSDFIPLRIFADILKQSMNTSSTLSDEFFKIRDQFTKKLLFKLVALQDMDQVLVTSLLLTIKSAEMIEDKIWILDLLRGQCESLSPSAMHFLSNTLIRRTFELESVLPGSTFSYPPQYILKSKYNINLSEIALSENTEETWDVKVLLFHILRIFPNTKYERLIDLCGTLNISHSDGFSLLLVSVLTNWDFRYKIVENELGFRELTIENNFSSMISKCMVIWQSIEDKEFLKDILNDIWKNGELIIHGCHISINPYYYEVYLCVYKMLFSMNNECKNLKQYYLLNFLKGYQRKSSPMQYEFELFSVKGMFPEIGHYRLPFHLFMREDMWSYLKYEITLETYERWLPVVALLSLDAEIQTAKDMICSNAVKQTMTNRKRFESNENDPKDNNEPWRLISLEEPLLRTAHRCVRHIANMEWAGACLFYVLQGCARGADQVAAAQLCYQFSQRWATLQPGNRAVRQMERIHSSLSTRHVLHKINWACEELIRLSTEPAQLIHALYLHPNLAEKFSRYDINRAANEIADKNGINISSVRIQILENLLEKTYKDNKNIHGLEVKDLITAKYILKATCPKMGAIYLSRIAFDEESDHNKYKKLRALQCLISVIDSDSAIKVTNRHRDILWTSLLELLYVVKLEKIGVPWVVATFMQNKTIALGQLLQVATNNLECLKISAELTHKFGNVQLMREMIPMLLRNSFYEEMIPLLLKVQNPPDNIIYSAWKAIILSPFQRADYPITDRQKSKCLYVLNLLPVCPVIKDEDLIEIWKNCIRCKCLGLGCLLLPYMSPETRQNLSELRKIDKRNLIISLKNLQTESYLVSGAMYVIENLTPKVYR